MVLMCWDVLTPREPLQGEYLGILIAQSFGRLARVEKSQLSLALPILVSR